LLNVTKKSVQLYKIKLKLLIKYSLKKNIFSSLRLINDKIDFWAKQFIFCFNKKYLCFELDFFVYKLLWRYLKKFHLKKTNTWIYSKYWRCFSGVWKFFVLDVTKGSFLFLKSHRSSKSFFVQNYIFKFSTFLNLFNMYNKEQVRYILFEKIKYTFLSSFACLYDNQKGLCYLCKRPIYSKNFKILTFTKRDSNLFENLSMVHFYCNIF
jgi:hypothetical protein